MIKLDVAIATHRPDGIRRVKAMQLPMVEGVRYVVSWQNHEGAPIPQELLRSDIKIARFSGKGVSANRNNALRYTSAPIVLFADDDLTYTPARLQSVIDTMEAHPNVDVGTFQYEGDNKRYPSEPSLISLHKPRWLSFTTFEIAIRSKCLNKLHFDERFGPNGSLFPIGEDEKFMLDAIKSGLICYYFPIVITSHTGPTTGFRAITDAKAAEGTGCLIRGRYPWSWPLRIPLKAYRLWKNGSKFGFCLLYMTKGAMTDCTIV